MPEFPHILRLCLTADASSPTDALSLRSRLRQALIDIDPQYLPLQQGLQYSSYVLEQTRDFVIHRVTCDERVVEIAAGIFFDGVIAGCSCSDDPTPTDTVTEYCEVLISLDRQTAQTEIVLR